MSLEGCNYLALLQAPLVPALQNESPFECKKVTGSAGLENRRVNDFVTLKCSISEG